MNAYARSESKEETTASANYHLNTTTAQRAAASGSVAGRIGGIAQMLNSSPKAAQLSRLKETMDSRPDIAVQRKPIMRMEESQEKRPGGGSLMHLTSSANPPIQRKPVDDKGSEYTVVIQAADKVIGRYDDDPGTAIIIAKNPSKNDAVLEEWSLLDQLAEQGAPVIPVFGSPFYVTYPEDSSNECLAFRAKWVEGLHSKTDKPDFERALSENKEDQTLLDDFGKLSDFISEVAGIGDLQVMFESATGHLYVIDPRSIGAADPDQPFIRRWTALIWEGAEPTKAESYKKVD